MAPCRGELLGPLMGDAELMAGTDLLMFDTLESDEILQGAMQSDEPIVPDTETVAQDATGV